VDLDRSIPGSSAIHGADPRLKLVATVATILAISLLPVGAWAAFALAWLGLLVAAGVAGIGIGRPSRNAFIAAPFLLAALPLVVVRTGDPLGTVGPFTLSGEGLRIVGTIAAKSWLSVQAALILTYTTPFHDLVDALRDLRVPRILVAIIGFMYRYLGVLGDEAGRMLRARSARSAAVGPGSGGTLRWRASVTGSMVGSLFLRSYERSERVYAAMQARGFDGTFRHLGTVPIGPSAWVTLAGVLVALAGLVAGAHLLLPAP
jgi:cobalt/nickel transport system permease protein